MERLSEQSQEQLRKADETLSSLREALKSEEDNASREKEGSRSTFRRKNSRSRR